MRVRDFDDPADEDYERILDEQRERDERTDRFAEKGPVVPRVSPLTYRVEMWTTAYSTAGEMQRVCDSRRDAGPCLPRFTADDPQMRCTYCSRPMED